MKILLVYLSPKFKNMTRSLYQPIIVSASYMSSLGGFSDIIECLTSKLLMRLLHYWIIRTFRLKSQTPTPENKKTADIAKALIPKDKIVNIISKASARNPYGPQKYARSIIARNPQKTPARFTKITTLLLCLSQIRSTTSVAKVWQGSSCIVQISP